MALQSAFAKWDGLLQPRFAKLQSSDTKALSRVRPSTLQALQKGDRGFASFAVGL
jgi:hypothetical protein